MTITNFLSFHLQDFFQAKITSAKSVVQKNSKKIIEIRLATINKLIPDGKAPLQGFAVTKKMFIVINCPPCEFNNQRRQSVCEVLENNLF